MRKGLFFILLLAVTHGSSGQDIYKAIKGEVSFYSYAPLEDISAVSNQVNSFINIPGNEFAFVIPMTSFQFKKSKMQEHFNEKYVESDKYPLATFNGSISENISKLNHGTFNVTAKGKMKIHGVEKEISERGRIEIKKDTIILNSFFNVALADYNITIPSLLFNNIADTIEVKLNATYVPYKGK